MSMKKGKKQIIIYSTLTCLMLCSPLSMASTTLSNGNSNGNCNADTAAAISKASNEAGNLAKSVYEKVPQPEKLSSSTCFSSILSMGDKIGLSFFNGESLIQSLENMVCQAAQSALSWPESQLNGDINQYGQLPDGLGGINATTTDNGSGITTTTNDNASGPSLPSLPSTNNSTLSGALG